MPGALLQRLGLREGDQVRVMQGQGTAVLPAGRDDSLPADCVRIAAADPATEMLGPLFGTVTLERVAVQAGVAV
jgi:NADH-quinone oxidoreductase subunit G